MRKINIFILLIISLSLTACFNNKEVVEKNEKKDKKELTCTGSSIDNGMSFSSKLSVIYKEDKISEGTFTVELKLPEDADDEEKEMLKNFSLCSSDIMTDLVNYGKCTTEINENELKSTLKIKKSLVEDYDKTIDDLKEELEKNTNINGNCKIK